MGNLTKHVGVFPPSELQVRKSTFDGLSGIFPVTFEAFDPTSSLVPDACIFLGKSPAVASPLDIPCYLWELSSAAARLDSTQVTFGSWPELHYALRGQSLTEATSREVGFLPVEGNDIVVADIGNRPVWTVRGLVHRVAVEPPRLGENEALCTHFEARRWLGLLPLLQFLRSVTRDIGWQEPPLRACFMFDDPNLHAFTYGHLDYREIARKAREDNYHVVFATVPADGWYVKPAVASLFREQANYISLTTHGIEHTKAELNHTHGNALPLLASGLRRLKKLERKAGLQVSRVMVPPHEAWSHSICDCLLKLGYEGACAGPEHLAARNRETSLPQHWGLGTVSWVGAGFPILHRSAFRLSSAETEIRLAAFLGQPVILKGHHGDCFSGTDVLCRLADVSNKLGARWGDMKSIMRSNYRTRTTAEILHIHMCSRQIQLRIPECVRGITIERPWLGETEQEPLLCTGADGGTMALLFGRHAGPIEVVPGSTVHVSALPKEQVDYRNVAESGVSLWAVIRRLLVEGRDRLEPLLGVNT